MCIRDSLYTALGTPLLSESVTENLQEEVEYEILPDRQFVTCLLYTSDAADERSSVDLGGRRIIKKNKCS